MNTMVRSAGEAYAAVENNKAAKEFFQVAAILSLSKNKKDAILFAQKQAGISPRVITMLQQKANPGVVDPGSSEWGMEAQLGTGMLGAQAGTSAFDAALPFMQQFPPQTKISVIVGNAVGAQVESGQLKVLSQLEVSANTLGQKRVAVILVTTAELMRLAITGGVPALQQAVRVAVATSTDLTWITDLKTGLTPITSTGTFLGDLRAASEAITMGAASRLFCVISSLNARRISFAEGTDGHLLHPGMTPLGGSLNGCTVLVSEAAADTELLAFSSSAVAANGGTITTDQSTQALLDMDGMGSLMDLFGRNMAALRCERSFSSALVRSDGAALINAIDYSTGS